MNLPNANRAVVDIEKLSAYCLDPSHPSGRHKARVFLSSLGISLAQADLLRDALLAAATAGDCRARGHTRYGSLYEIEFRCEHQGRSATVRSGWIVRASEDFARLTSCYVVF